MACGAVRTDLNTTGTSYRNGYTINTSTHSFGNAIPAAHDYLNTNPIPISDDTFDSNPISWTVAPTHFGNSIS